MFLDFISSVAKYANIIVPILVAIGVIFCIIEAFVPSFGFFGIVGILSFVCGIIAFAFAYEIWKVAILVVGIALFVIFVFLLMAKVSKSGKSAIFDNKTALPIDYDLETMVDNSKFINKFGEVVADCKPTGKVKIDNEIIVVCANKNYIEKGTMVKVIEVNEDKIIVDLAK